MSKNKARLSILNELLSFPTIRSKDWYADWPDQKAAIGDLVALNSAPPSKWYVSWYIDTRNTNGMREYLLESIDDGDLCWWGNIGLSYYSRERVKENPQWKWDDRQFAFSERWFRVCRQSEVYPVRAMQPIFTGESVELNVRLHIFYEANFRNPKSFENWKKVTMKEMESYYRESADLYSKQKKASK